MKKHLLIAIIAFISILVVCFVACRKIGSLSDEGPATGELTIKQAKTYFYKVMRKESTYTVESSKDGKDHKIYPYWKLAYQATAYNYTYIEVPVFTRFLSAAMITKDIVDTAAAHKQMSLSFTRLVIFRYSNGVTGKRLVTYMPDADYAKKYNNDVSFNQLNKIGKDFSGNLQFKNWAGAVLYTVRYDNGVITHKFKSTTTESQSNSASRKIQQFRDDLMAKLKAKYPLQSKTLAPLTSTMQSKSLSQTTASGPKKLTFVCKITHVTYWTYVAIPSAPGSGITDDTNQFYFSDGTGTWIYEGDGDQQFCYDDGQVDCTQSINITDSACGGSRSDPPPSSDPDEVKPPRSTKLPDVTFVGPAYITQNISMSHVGSNWQISITNLHFDIYATYYQPEELPGEFPIYNSFDLPVNMGTVCFSIPDHWDPYGFGPAYPNYDLTSDDACYQLEYIYDEAIVGALEDLITQVDDPSVLEVYNRVKYRMYILSPTGSIDPNAYGGMINSLNAQINVGNNCGSGVPIIDGGTLY